MGRVVSLGLGMMVAIVAVLPSSALCAEPVVGIGEVTVAAARADDDVDDGTFRAIVEEAVGAIDSTRLPRGRSAVLSVSLVRLESGAQPPHDEMSCLVSATLRDRRGAVFAVLQGSARGHDEPRRRRSLEKALLRAAVAGALAGVPEAMRSRPR